MISGLLPIVRRSFFCYSYRMTYREHLISFAMMLLGAAAAAFAVSEFLAPNNIFDGGLIGVSMIVSHFLPMDTAVWVILLNIPFIILAARHLGAFFVVKALFSMGVFSIALEAFDTFTIATYDTLLATVFGGVILGIGVGLVMRGGGCMDGTEIIAILLNRHSVVSVGTIILMINIVIYAAAAVIFGLDSGLYSMLMYYITSKVIDIVQGGLEQERALMIISEDGPRIAQEIYDRFGRTATLLKGEGLISGTEKDAVYCIVTLNEVYYIRKMLSELDVDAFTTVSEVSEIIGNHVKKHHQKTREELQSSQEQGARGILTANPALRDRLNKEQKNHEPD